MPGQVAAEAVAGGAEVLLQTAAVEVPAGEPAGEPAVRQAEEGLPAPPWAQVSEQAVDPVVAVEPRTAAYEASHWKTYVTPSHSPFKLTHFM